MSILWTLKTGAGVWNPVAMVMVLAVATVIVLLIRSLGEKGYKKGTPQEDPFLSGNTTPEEGKEVQGSNLYWGFVESLKGLYARLVPLHTGVPTDYVLWLFAVMAVIVVIGLLA